MTHEIDAQCVRIVRKLKEAAAADPTLSVFGASSHKYAIGPTVSEAQIRAFETAHGIDLPPHYRAFLTQVGNGTPGAEDKAAAGPFYGIYPLGSGIILDSDGRACRLRKLPFIRPDMPQSEWDEATKTLAGEELSNDDYDQAIRRIWGGLLPIGDQGCSYYHVLVLRGPHAGRVANVDVELSGQPVFSFEANFLDWYERWLDEVISGPLRKEGQYWFGYTMRGDDQYLLNVFKEAHATPRIGDPKTKNANKSAKCGRKSATILPLKSGHFLAEKPASANAVPTKIKLNGHVARRDFGGKELSIWDTELPGFGLRVRSTGTKRWFVRYEERGRTRMWTIGDVKDVSAEAARGAALRRLREIALVGLPKKVASARAGQQVSMFADLVDQYLQDRPFAWKPSTERSNVACLKKRLLPVFGDLDIGLMRKQDILRWRDSMADRGGMFNRDVAILSGVLQYAEQLGLRKRGSNPARGMKRYKRETMQRFLEPAEYRRLELRLRECDDQVMAAAVRLLLHTGARPGEVAHLRWGEVSKERLELADSKTGPKSILLSRQAKGILDSLPRGADEAYVFDGRLGPSRTLSHFWTAFRRTAGLPDVRLHDLRHSYASIAIQNGINLEPIGRLLGHALTETTERYAHLTDQCIVDAAEIVGKSVFELMGWSDADAA